MDLGVDIAGIKLANPVLLASGTAGYGMELAPFVDLATLGGVVLKSVTMEPRRGNPPPRIWETAAGMLNSIGLENVGVDALLAEVLPGLRELGTAVVASIAGETAEEYARLAARVSGADGVSAIEVNLSCPNVGEGGMHFGADPAATGRVVAAVRAECGALPSFVKLSAAVTDLVKIAASAREAGASGLSLINTVPGLAIDPARRRPRLGAVTGGLSGPAIKPIALKAVWECHRGVGPPIIGGGGVYDVDDVLEFLIAGASAVAVGTALFQQPDRPAGLVRSLPDALARIGAASAREVVGTLRV